MAEKILKTKSLYLFVIVAWLILVIVFTSIIVKFSLDDANETFQTKAHNLYHLVNDQVNLNETILDGFAATVDAMGKLDREKIRDYARRISAHDPYIFMFEIAEKIPHKDRAQFEREMREQVYPKFSIREFGYSSDRKWHPATDRPFYLPITFMEPFPEASREVLGLDLNSNQIFIQSLRESARLHTPVVTKPFKLVEGDIAYVMHRPIKEKTTHIPKDGIDDRYVMLVITAKSLFKNGSTLDPTLGVALYSDHLTDKSNDTLLFKQSLPNYGSLRCLLFPKLALTLPLKSRTQPFVLSIEQQLGWHSLNWNLLGLLTIGGIVTFLVMLRYARIYHLTQINRIQETNHLFYLANHDGLTGLANRNLLMDRLAHALIQAKRAGSRLAVLFLDLDNFKRINDNHGHAIGDKVLKRVAERLQLCVRSGDTLARLSGDEFVIILENISSEDMAEQIIEKIQNAFSQHIDIDGTEIAVSVSIGFANYPEEAQDAMELLKLADKRMYARK